MVEGIGQAIGCLVTIAIAGIIGVFLLGGYLTFDWVKGDILESKKRIVPEIRLTTDGKKVDTLFIYKLNK
jgi:hypothetical protein